MSTPTEKELQDLRDRVALLEGALEAIFARISRHESSDADDLDAALTAGKCAYEDG